jgi:type IX secretion system PorP/SprF family membrane protein
MKHFVLIWMLFSPLLFKGQDIHFSQFESTPTQVNPGAVGANGSYELIFGYRSQWRSLDQKFTTPVVTGILPFISKTNQVKGGIGLSALSEKSGSTFAFKNTGGALSFSYGINFKKLILLGGVSSAFYQRSFTGDFATGSQYQAGSGYNSGLATGEEGSNLSKSYFDVGAGLYFCDLNNTSYFGFSASHLTQPNIGLSGTDKLPMRYTVHGGYRLMKKSTTPVTPEFIVHYQNGLQRTLLGARLDYQVKGANGFGKDLSFGILARYALKDAMMLGLSMTKKYMTLAISQDFTISPIATYNKSMGATEVRLAMRIPSKKKQVPAAAENYNVGQAREFVVKKEEEKDNTKSYNLHIQETVKFAFNDTALTTEGKRITADVAQLLKGNKYLKVKIIGHSDNLGSKKRNQEISEKRAKMVMEYLISQGIDKKRIQVVAKGDSEPIKPNDSEEGRTLNRRVEFELWK